MDKEKSEKIFCIVDIIEIGAQRTEHPSHDAKLD